MATSLTGTGLPLAGGGVRMGSSEAGEVNLIKQPITGLGVYTAAAAPLLVSDLTNGFLTYNAAGANNLQLPTVASLEATVTAAQAADGFDFSVAATGAGTGTITTNTGWTLVGSMAVATTISGRFRAVKTGTGTWTLYRIS